MRVLSRAWQMLLKGTAEVQAAAKPLAAAEMVLVRIAYAADLPTPDEVIRSLDGNGGSSPRPHGNGGGAGASGVSATASTAAARYEAPRGAPRAMMSVATQPKARLVSDAVPQTAPAAPAFVINSFPELVALAADKRDIQTKLALERDVRLVRCEDGKLEIALEPGATRTLVNDLSRKLQEWTGRPWVVVVSREPGQPTLKSVAEARKAEFEIGVRADPLVKAVLERFPGAEIVRVQGHDQSASGSPAQASPAPDTETDTDTDGDFDFPPPDEDGFGDNWERDD
jgi:DNA polymerase-3 subunit gamma/tau